MGTFLEKRGASTIRRLDRSRKMLARAIDQGMTDKTINRWIASVARNEREVLETQAALHARGLPHLPNCYLCGCEPDPNSWECPRCGTV